MPQNRAMRSGKLVTWIDRYLFRQLFLALAAVTGGLTALIWLTQSLRFVELVVNRGLSMTVFVRLTSLLIPSFVAVILPITTYVVIQFIYQRLAGDRELTVMRSAGISPIGMARPALALAFLAMAAGYVLNLWVVPSTLSAFRQYQWDIRTRMAAFLLQDGVFTPISGNLTVYVRSRDTDGTLRGILVEDDRDRSARATILAETGRLKDGTNGPRALLFNGSRQEIDHTTSRLNMLTFDQNELDLGEKTTDIGERPPDMSEVSVWDLLNPRAAHDQDRAKWVAEGHKRLSSPLSTLSFALIALVAVLSGAFRRHGGVVRPLVAVGTVVGLLAFGLAVNNVAARNNGLVPLMWAQAVLPGLVCLWMLLVPDWIAQRFRPPQIAD
ncbi:MAG: LPS export ABC transporter permease LptF [Rhodospirillales bacterium]